MFTTMTGIGSTETNVGPDIGAKTSTSKESKPTQIVIHEDWSDNITESAVENCKADTKTLTKPFNCQQVSLNHFLKQLATRAAEFGWTDDGGILLIPDNICDMSVTKNLLTQYGEISLESVRQHELTYIADESCKAQDSTKLYHNICESLTSEASRAIELLEDQYTLEVNDKTYKSGPLLLKTVINESHNDTPISIEVHQEPEPRYIQEEPANLGEHLGAHRQYWRDMILGINDGLVSTFLLVAGVAGSGLSSRNILLTAIAGALAGAVSMSAGEYIATKSQNEVTHGEIGLERQHIRYRKEQELEEVKGLLEIIGISRANEALHTALIDHYRSDSEALLKVMIALEFGFVEEEERSPLAAAALSGILFTLGALPSLLPFIPTDIQPKDALLVAAFATILVLLIVGGIKAWATRGNFFAAALENLTVAGVGGGLAYGVGALFDWLI